MKNAGRETLLWIAAALVALSIGMLGAARAETPWPPVATFSILGFDPATGEVGGVVQSRVFSVGNGVLWAEAGVGVVARSVEARRLRHPCHPFDVASKLELCACPGRDAIAVAHLSHAGNVPAPYAPAP